MARDSRTKRYAEQIEVDASTNYMPIISGGTTDNVLILNSDGEAEDSDYDLSDIEAFSFFCGNR